MVKVAFMLAMVPKMHSRKGFTLLEVLIATVIFTVGVVAIVNLFSDAFAASSDPEMTAIAMNLAQQKLEEIRNLDFVAAIVNKPKEDVAGFLGFKREVVVVEPVRDLKQVTVNVFWLHKGSEVATSLSTYISKN